MALICFPLADQLEMANWVRHDLKGFGANGKSGAYSRELTFCGSELGC